MYGRNMKKKNRAVKQGRRADVPPGRTDFRTDETSVKSRNMGKRRGGF